MFERAGKWLLIFGYFIQGFVIFNGFLVGAAYLNTLFLRLLPILVRYYGQDCFSALAISFIMHGQV